MTFARPLALLALLLAGPASAQVADPDSVLVEELVVTGRLPGPAWWRVSDADTTVYILALPETDIPPGLAWGCPAARRAS